MKGCPFDEPNCFNPDKTVDTMNQTPKETIKAALRKCDTEEEDVSNILFNVYPEEMKEICKALEMKDSEHLERLKELRDDIKRNSLSELGIHYAIRILDNAINDKK